MSVYSRARCLFNIYMYMIFTVDFVQEILSIRKYEHDFINTVTIEFDDSFPSSLSSDELLMLNILVLFT